MPVLHSVLNVKAVVAAFNQEKALVGAFSVIVQPVVEPMDRFAALLNINKSEETSRIRIFNFPANLETLNNIKYETNAGW